MINTDGIDVSLLREARIIGVCVVKQPSFFNEEEEHLQIRFIPKGKRKPRQLIIKHDEKDMWLGIVAE